MVNELDHIKRSLEVLHSIMEDDDYSLSALNKVISILQFNEAKESGLNSFPHLVATKQTNLSKLTPTEILNVSALCALFKWNVSAQTNLYPTQFNKRASFTFNGEYVRAQYFYSFGLGILLQLGGRRIGPMQAVLAKHILDINFPFAESNAWRLVGIFPADSAEDGPEYSEYSTMDAAREGYQKEQDAKMAKQLAGSESDVKSESDDDDDEGAQLSPTEASFDIL